MDPFAPAPLGPRTLRNRVVKAATFEGMAVDGLVTDALVDFHRRVAAGGVGMTTVAFMAVSEDGQAAPGEIVLRPAAATGLARLAEAVHAEGAAISAQIGHAGPVAAATRRRALSPSRAITPTLPPVSRALSERDITRVTADFAAAGALVRDAGFDAVEVHLGHNYLLSAFLSPALNRRTDRWGGSVERRAAFPRQVVRAVRDAVGSDRAVLVKLNMTDGYRGGLTVDDSLAVAQLLQEDGTVDAIELTGGSSLRNPMYLFRGDAPLADLARAFPFPLNLGLRASGHRFLRTYPFEEAYFLQTARQFLRALPVPLILLGGITRLETVRAALDEGFAFVAMARALLREPDLVRRWQGGDAAPSPCDHNNRCMATIYGRTHCVLVPAGDRPGHDVSRSRRP